MASTPAINRPIQAAHINTTKNACTDLLTLALLVSSKIFIDIYMKLVEQNPYRQTLVTAAFRIGLDQANHVKYTTEMASAITLCT